MKLPVISTVPDFTVPGSRMPGIVSPVVLGDRRWVTSMEATLKFFLLIDAISETAV